MDVPDSLQTGDNIDIFDSWDPLDDDGQGSTIERRTNPFHHRPRKPLADLFESPAEVKWREEQSIQTPNYLEEYASLSKVTVQDDPTKGDTLQKSASSEGSAIRTESIAPAQVDLDPSTDFAGPSVPRVDLLRETPRSVLTVPCEHCGKVFSSKIEAQ